MSADIGVPWRSSTTVCGSESRSPSISSLPPLPALIPIRTGNTLIKAKPKHASKLTERRSATSTTSTDLEMNESFDSNAEGVVSTSMASTTNGSDAKRQHQNNHTNSGKCKDIDQRNSASLSVAIKTERQPNDDDSAISAIEQANSADAMCPSICVRIGGKHHRVNGSTSDTMYNVSSVKSEQLLCVNATSNLSFSNSDELCREQTMSDNNHSDSEQMGGDRDNVSESLATNVQTVNKNGMPKKKRKFITDLPKRTTRSAVDTYECKARMYTPLPAQFYSVQYTRAARKPKKKQLKRNGRNNSATKTTKPATKPKANGSAPQINPIFLFVKRDDTRILEVRCEDYDKRNRIRLTKTANGWRATPRTTETTTADATSTTMSPKVMIERLKESEINVQSTGQKGENVNSQSQQAESTTKTDKKTNWRVNPYSKSRISLSKERTSSSATDDTVQQNQLSSDGCQSSVVDHSSGVDTSTSERLTDTLDRLLRKKHKKKKKSKKTKYKTKLKKVAEKESGRRSSFADCLTTTSMEADDVDEMMAHATQTHEPRPSQESAPSKVAVSAKNASECKFTIRLSKNGETSFVATSTASTQPRAQSSPAKFSASQSTTTNTVTTTTFTTTSNINLDINANASTNTSSTHRINRSLPSDTTEFAYNDGAEMVESKDLLQTFCIDIDGNHRNGGGGSGGGDDNNNNSENDANSLGDSKVGLNVLTHPCSSDACVLSETIDYGKIDTKKEIVTPSVSPYHEPAYPTLQYQPIEMLNNASLVETLEQQSESRQPLQASSTSSEKSNSTALTICENPANDTFVSLNNSICATFTKQEPIVSSASFISQATFVHSNIDNNRREKHFDCDNNLLDDESYYNNASEQLNVPSKENSANDAIDLHHDLGELIAGIQNIGEANDVDDLMDRCSENTLSGTDLLDSLVERGLEDNNITGVVDDDDVVSIQQHQRSDLKDSICLSDFSDVDTSLLLSQAGADIFSRLNNEAMTSSPKCLSFSEASEIERIGGTFASGKSDNRNLLSFNHTAFDEFSLTLNAPDKHANAANANASDQQNDAKIVVSPDSCEDELPKDLSYKKTKDGATSLRIPSPRTISRGSDAIQSPQPSGVPPSPDILNVLQQPSIRSITGKKQHPLFLDMLSSSSPKSSDANILNAKNDFMDLTSPLSKDNEHGNLNSITNMNATSSMFGNMSRSILKRTLQKEPSDSGSKHRKSASPTVTCSEEVNRSRCDDTRTLSSLLSAAKSTSQNDSTSTKDPDPLTQLRLLVSNPEWKLPDPILVPKNRLNAVLASPAREIPLLLTTRPELRLPEAFAYPSILQDPDILVISFAQLETIIRKQNEFLKDTEALKEVPSSKPSTSGQSQTMQADQQQRMNIGLKNRKHLDKIAELQANREKTHTKTPLPSPRQESAPILPANNASNEMNPLDTLNQILWLSQISQMSQLTPDLLKLLTMANLPLQYSPFNTQNPFAMQSAFANHTSPALAELAMWQEAAANKTAMQRYMEQNAQNNRDAQRKAMNDVKQQQRNQENIAAALRRQSIHQPQPPTKPMANLFQTFQARTQSQSKRSPSFLASPTSTFDKEPTESQPASQLRPPSLPKRPGNLQFLNRTSMLQAQPSIYGATTNSLANMSNNNGMNNLAELQKLYMGGNNAPSPLRKVRKETTLQQQHQQHQQQQQHQQHQQQHLQLQSMLMQNVQSNMLGSSNQSTTNANVSCKSLVNLLRPTDLEQMRSPASDTQMASPKLPTINCLSPNSTPNASGNQPKLRVKPGLHLLDPHAMHRRLLSGNTSQCDDSLEIGSTTNALDDIMMNSAHMNAQANNYASQWQWTKVTATGE